MKKIFLFIVAVFLFANLIFAQHKIVFDFTKADTASFSTMVRHAKKYYVEDRERELGNCLSWTRVGSAGEKTRRLFKMK
jgi:hypothetical protein